jgi:hypothetical protein
MAEATTARRKSWDTDKPGGQRGVKLGLRNMPDSVSPCIVFRVFSSN